MISQDAILTGVFTLLNSATSIATVCGAWNRVVKGAKRPDTLANPSITLQMPVMELPGGHWGGTNPLARTQRGPILISAFADNAANGAMDFARLNTMTSNIGSIVSGTLPTISGVAIHRTGQWIESGPLYDTQDPHEAYKVMQIGWAISEV